MLRIVIPSIEIYDAVKNEFTMTAEYKLQLEHSLVSLSKWESKWEKPFLSKERKTREEAIDYVRCMTITQNIPPDAYLAMSQKILDQVGDYIEAPMTATIISKKKSAPSREPITSEVIYFWMISHNIPFECEKWHLNRLLTLINVCNIKNQSPKKISNKELLAGNRALNEARRKQLNTRG